jgi:hypothetical protein
MATENELIQEYARVTAELTTHEAGVEKAKEARKGIAKQLFELHGKGHVYDFGDGKPMIIVKSKSDTYFFTPKDKWKKGGRKKKAPAEPKKVEVSATLRAKAEVQNVPVPEGARTKTEPPPTEPPAEATERYKPPRYDGPNIPAASPELTVKLEQQAPKEAPSKAPELTGDPDVDALAQALAELE